MKLATDRIRRLARARGLSLSALLDRAGVSRTAYYSLARRRTVLPKTVHAVADALDVPPSDLLDEPAAGALDEAFARIDEVRSICEREPGADFDTVRHTLALLDLPPLERLNRSLTRGRTAVHG